LNKSAEKVVRIPMRVKLIFRQGWIKYYFEKLEIMPNQNINTAEISPLIKIPLFMFFDWKISVLTLPHGFFEPKVYSERKSSLKRTAYFLKKCLQIG
jgi:hypothetical protein